MFDRNAWQRKWNADHREHVNKQARLRRNDRTREVEKRYEQTRSRVRSKGKSDQSIYNCRRCKDTNWMIECKCGCGGIRSKRMRNGSHYLLREWIHGHQPDGNKAYNGKWKNGYTSSNGYRFIRRKNHPFADVKGYVQEHRIVWEESNNGAILLPWTAIHHKDDDRLNNRIDNLQPMFKGDHIRLHKKGIHKLKIIQRF